jgi:repressor LexA
MTTDVQPLTEAQASVYRWICGYITKHGYSPTVREIQTAFAWDSVNGAMCHLLPLRKKGWINWQENQARTIRPVEVANV